MSEELEILFPGKEVKAAGEVFNITPLFAGQIPKAAKLFAPVGQSLLRNGCITMEDIGGGKKKIAIVDDIALKIPDLIGDAGEALLEFTAFIIGKKRSWFDRCPLDDYYQLVFTIFDENKRFFMERMMPLLGWALNPQATGETSTSDSSPTSVETKSTEVP